MEMASNFIHDIIDEELKSGKVDSVYTRFPPEPNGYLHIGHAKSICLNFGTAKKYGGKCNLRFDDTNPSKEDVEYVNSIMEDIHWLGFEWDALFYASDYFEKMYEFAELLIQKGKAYVCDLCAEEIREYRGTLTSPGKDSPYRERSAEESLQLFRDMRDGKFKEGERVLRAKIDMSSPNLNMRDPVIYRVMYRSHHNTGDKWCIYPMYDYAHPISDAIEGITHSICTLEFEDHRPLYDWVVEHCGFEKRPRQIEFARLNITNTIMSKRFLKRLVDEKLVDGWDDPRMPTLCGIRKRGYPAEAVKDFCDKIGVAKANSEVESALLDFCVREKLNASAERAMAVTEPLELLITNYNLDGEDVECEINPGDTSLAEGEKHRKIRFGKRLYIDRDDFSDNPPPKYFRLMPGGYVRLRSAYIVRCDKVEYAKDGSVERVLCSYVENSRSGNDTSGIKVKGVIHWVNADTAVPADIVKYAPLLDPDSSEEDFTKRINPDSKIVYKGYVEPYLAGKNDGESFQFIRSGYFIKDGSSFREIVGLKDNFNRARK